jgi:hypothetical protein
MPSAATSITIDPGFVKANCPETVISTTTMGPRPHSEQNQLLSRFRQPCREYCGEKGKGRILRQ